MNITINCFAYR